MLSSDVADLLMNTDADTDTDTVNWVETVEWCFTMKKLSSPHHDLSGKYRSSLICLEQTLLRSKKLFAEPPPFTV